MFRPLTQTLGAQLPFPTIHYVCRCCQAASIALDWTKKQGGPFVSANADYYYYEIKNQNNVMKEKSIPTPSLT
jgi:hypothetical protein